jgi:hypothetical protein
MLLPEIPEQNLGFGYFGFGFGYSGFGFRVTGFLPSPTYNEPARLVKESSQKINSARLVYEIGLPRLVRDPEKKYAYRYTTI